MSQPQPQPQPQPKLNRQPLRVLCPECGAIVEVVDPEGLVRALHLRNDCLVSPLLAGAQD
jgi:hypothetical protein